MLKFMKRFLIVFLIFSFYASYTEEYLLLPLQQHFSSINWVESSTLDLSKLPTPYEIGYANDVFFYADTISEDSIFPQIEGLGILDYTNTSYPLIESMQRFSTSIISKKMASGLNVEERSFLPPLFAYRLKNMKGVEHIDYVFFSTPTFTSENKAVSKFRLSYKRDGTPKYRLMEGTFIKENDIWLLESFDFIGWEIDASPF